MMNITQANTKEQSVLFKDKIKEIYKGSSTIVSLLMALIVMGIIFTILSPYFLTVQNILNIGIYASIMGVMAAGLTVGMLLGGMDISQYATAALSGVILAMLLKANVPVVYVVIAAMGIAVLCGALNGFVVTVLKINPIITTLATGLIFRGIAYYLSGAGAIIVDNKFFTFLGRGYILNIPNTIWIMAIVYFIVFILLKYTSFGRKVFAVGGNPQASFLSGININAVRFGAFIVCGIAAGLAGIMFVSQLGAAMPQAGESALMDVIVAVILGGISLAGGKGRISGTLLGVLILAIISNGMVLLSVESYLQMVIRGLIIVIAVYIDVVRGGGYR